MRILMSLYNQVGRGTYWRALPLAQELGARGHEVTLMAISPARRGSFGSQTIKDVEVVETPDLLPGSLRSGWDPWDVVARMGWLRGRAFDVAHAFEGRPVALLPALFVHRRQGIPLLLDWCDWFGRGGSLEERSSPLVRAVLGPVETFFEEAPRSRASGGTVINRVLRDKALALGVKPERLLLLPNGCNVDDIHPAGREEARRDLGLPLDAELIAYTGAIFRQDAHLMAAAFDRIRAAHPRARLLLVGYCNLAVEELVQEPAAVLRTGPVSYSRLARYLAACDLGWLPLCNSGANRGRSPLKMHDMIAAGRPVVATRVGDVHWLEEAGIGRLATDTPEDLARQTTELLENRDELEQKGRLARYLAETELAWEHQASKLEAFYRCFLDRS
ncbi:MAG: glycosyltransferase family 4 protein [Anaerolineae bacterium]|nr:glycosyltransferase family 4 protein [Anaerolineae bacterium]